MKAEAAPHEPVSTVERCHWATGVNLRYHDEEWGVPIHDDRVWFEFLTLEGAQAGLSWETILKKREQYRKVFAGFDPAKVARFDRKKIRTLLGDPGIIRNRLKVSPQFRMRTHFCWYKKNLGASMLTSGNWLEECLFRIDGRLTGVCRLRRSWPQKSVRS